MIRRKKMLILFSSILLIAAAVAAGIFYFRTFARACNPPLSRATVHVGKTAFDAEVARTIAEQACGLSGRAGLGDGQGMLFTFGTPSIQHFWMKDMNFPIDIVWIGGGKVLGFAEDAPAPPPGTSIFRLKIYDSPDGTDTVLEVPAGTVAKDGIKVGDAVQVGAE